MILDLVDEDHLLLRQKMEPFDLDNPPCDPVQLANSLIETMHHHRGLGLSANQCGLPYRVFALWSQDPIVCFNPRIVDVSNEIVQLEEGCLTYPYMHLKIKRPKMIKVRFNNCFGDIFTDKYTGMTARVFQHELDHLNGEIFLRRANNIHVQRARNNQKHMMRAAKRGELVTKQFDGTQYEQKIQVQ
jgi:peptide deformylase